MGRWGTCCVTHGNRQRWPVDDSPPLYQPHTHTRAHTIQRDAHAIRRDTHAGRDDIIACFFALDFQHKHRRPTGRLRKHIHVYARNYRRTHEHATWSARRAGGDGGDGGIRMTHTSMTKPLPPITRTREEEDDGHIIWMQTHIPGSLLSEALTGCTLYKGKGRYSAFKINRDEFKTSTVSGSCLYSWEALSVKNQLKNDIMELLFQYEISMRAWRRDHHRYIKDIYIYIYT